MELKMRNDFTVYRRKTAKHLQFYALFRDPDTGERNTYRSVDQLNYLLGGIFKKNITSKQQAILVAQQALDKGIVFNRCTNLSFIQYCQSYWDFDKSEYIKRKNKEKPNSISKAYAVGQLSILNRYVAPVIPSNMSVNQFKPSIAEQIKRKMFDSDCSTTTINNALQAIRSPLKQAFISGMISDDISCRIKNVSRNQQKERGIPTGDEVSKLLNHLNCTYDKNSEYRMKFLIPAVAIYTGMRQGEIRALHASDISCIDDESGVIRIAHGYNNKDGLKCTKGKKARYATAPAELCRELIDYAKRNPIKDGFIFCSLKKNTVPIVSNAVLDWFREGLEEIGISLEEQLERNLTFHSLRHYWATAMEQVLSDDDRRKVLGHQSQEMTDHYTHETEDRLKRLDRKRAEILPYIF